MRKQEIALCAVEALKKEYPDAICSLTYTDPLQLLIATRLSAQCTDARVNMVTPALFERFPTVDDFAAASYDEVAEYIKSCGLFKTKSKDIVEMCKKLRTDFGGEVPDTIEALTTLPGVGRKTANVIRGNIYRIPSIVVDTHVGRLARRFGLSENTDPEKVEYDLMKKLPKDRWTEAHHSLIFHGRNRCIARKPDCEGCELKDICLKKGL